MGEIQDACGQRLALFVAEAFAAVVARRNPAAAARVARAGIGIVEAIDAIAGSARTGAVVAASDPAQRMSIRPSQTLAQAAVPLREQRLELCPNCA